MGYTHYWGHLTIDSDTWAALVADARRVIATSDAEVCGPDAIGEPEFGDEELALNGSFVLDQDYEPFVLSRKTASAFCKTDRRQYDAVVGAILLRAVHLVPGFVLNSDGWWERDWSAPRELYAKTFGESPAKPADLRD